MFDSIWLFLIILIVGFFLNMLRNAISSRILGTFLDIIAFIGIVIHELCHYTMSLLMGIVPSEIKVSYREMRGHIRSRVGSFLQAFLVGLAPLFISSYIAWFCFDIALNASFIWYYRLLAGIIVISILIAAGPSAADISSIKVGFTNNPLKSLSQIGVVILLGLIVYILTFDIFIPAKFSFLYFIFIGFGYIILKYSAIGVKFMINYVAGNNGYNKSSRHNYMNSIPTLKPTKNKKNNDNQISLVSFSDFLNDTSDKSSEEQLGENIALDNFIEILTKSGKRKKIKIELGQW